MNKTERLEAYRFWKDSWSEQEPESKPTLTIRSIAPVKGFRGQDETVLVVVRTTHPTRVVFFVNELGFHFIYSDSDGFNKFDHAIRINTENIWLNKEKIFVEVFKHVKTLEICYQSFYKNLSDVQT